MLYQVAELGYAHWNGCRANILWNKWVSRKCALKGLIKPIKCNKYTSYLKLLERHICVYIVGNSKKIKCFLLCWEWECDLKLACSIDIWITSCSSSMCALKNIYCDLDVKLWRETRINWKSQILERGSNTKQRKHTTKPNKNPYKCKIDDWKTFNLLFFVGILFGIHTGWFTTRFITAWTIPIA